MIHVTRKTKIPCNLSIRQIRHIAELTFAARDISGEASIIFTDNREIQSLNTIYRNMNSITDVLSFSSNEIDPNSGKTYLGDVVISIEQANRQADESDKLRSDELIMLIVHGCLHLSGLDHETEKQREVMKSFQERILINLEVKSYTWPEI
jgi:probable rRNA maturation factor